MISRKLLSAAAPALALAGAMFLAAPMAHAGMAPVFAGAATAGYVQPIECDVGLRLGPLGGCIAGHADPERDDNDAHRHHRHCWNDNDGNRTCKD